MNLRSPRVDPSARQRGWCGRWLATGLLLALTPKCLLCLFGYAGLGAALGFGGPELCGAATPGWHWTTWLAISGVAIATAGAIRVRHCSATR